jgi:hypothetical protein
VSAAGWDDERRQLLTAGAGDLAGVALANVVREYPHCEFHWQIEGEHIPTPRQLHPSFYGSLDWHSCVEMFWVLVRLLRCHADLVQVTTQRPYGWSALLELAHETATWADPDAARWSAALQELSEVFVTRYLDWLPKATYPVRHGVHTTDAFGLSRALPYANYLAENGEPQLQQVITETAWRWFGSTSIIRAPGSPAGLTSCPRP